MSNFAFNAHGRIAFLRKSENNSLAILVVDQQGNLIHSVPLDPAHAENSAGWSNLTCLGPEKFLLFRDNPADRNKMAGVFVDVATGKTTPIPGFTTTVLSQVASFRDGGFVVLGGRADFSGTSAGDHGLRCFDARGNRVWSVPGSGNPVDPASLFGPTELTVTTERLVAVFDPHRDTVQFFDRTGKHHHTDNLKEAWGRKPTYPTGLSADQDGGIVVEQFQGDPPIVRMNADGSIRGQVKPRLKDGRKIALRDAQVAPDGVLWVSDGHALFRLIQSGVVGRVLGRSTRAAHV